MNIYRIAARVIADAKDKKGSIKSLIYGSKHELKGQLTALVCKTLENEKLLTEVLKKAKLLDSENLLDHDPHLTSVLLYELLLGKQFLAESSGDVQCLLNENYEVLSTILDELSPLANTEQDLTQDKPGVRVPRYVRVNLIKASVADVVQQFSDDGFEDVSPVDKKTKRFRKAVSSLQREQFFQDPHIPDLLVFPAGTDFHDHPLYKSGAIVLQDKASCMPAHILSPPHGAFVADCCGAPGNKTSHMASIMENSGKIFAFEIDKDRADIMNNLIGRAGVKSAQVKNGDFRRTDLFQTPICDVTHVLLDPSCSGSGIVSRMNAFTDDAESSSETRLQSLFRSQVMLLKHALRFPKAQLIVYSTCSVYAEENEQVIDEAYAQWNRRYQLKKILPDHRERGLAGYECSDYVVRFSHEKHLTNGFFIACFERRHVENHDVPRSIKSASKHKVNEKADEDDESSSKRSRPELSNSNGAESPVKNESKQKSKKKTRKDRRMREDSTLKITLSNPVEINQSDVDSDNAMETIKLKTLNKSPKKRKKVKKNIEPKESDDNSNNVSKTVNLKSLRKSQKKHKDC